MLQVFSMLYYFRSGSLVAFATIFISQPGLDATVIFFISKAIEEKSIFRSNIVISIIFGRLQFCLK